MGQFCIRLRGAIRQRNTRSREAGYAYMLALFMIVIVIASSGAVLRNLATEGRRQREEETIWRGNQWVRAIRFYYHKRGYYPRTAEDLEKGLPGIHFLRPAAFKNPTNADDGSWRFIYTNSTGQIIGSVRYATLQQMALMDLNGGKLPGGPQGALPGVPAASTTSMSGASMAGSDTSGAASGETGSSDTSNQNSQTSQQSVAAGGQTSNPVAQLQPTGAVDGPVLGGFLTGVGSKSDRPSIKIYHGGKKYKEWEFIWNPLEDQAQALQQGLNPQGQQSGQPGQPGAAGSTGDSTPPESLPGSPEAEPTLGPNQPEK